MSSVLVRPVRLPLVGSPPPTSLDIHHLFLEKRETVAAPFCNRLVVKCHIDGMECDTHYTTLLATTLFVLMLTYLFFIIIRASNNVTNYANN